MTPTASAISSIRILGARIHIIRVVDVVKAMEHWIQNEPDQLHHVINTGMHGIMEAHRSPQIMSILNSADLVAPDGILTILVARFYGHRLRKKDTGPELLSKFSETAQVRNYRFYFYGDTEETLEQLTLNLASEYPGIEVVGKHAPPFRALTPEEDEAIVAEINQARPDVLWVGLGMPKQELWIHEHRESLRVTVAVGAGAALKFMSGHVDRAPVRVQNLGFEWLWRLWQEPKRVWRRVFVDAPQFIVLTSLELLNLRKFD